MAHYNIVLLTTATYYNSCIGMNVMFCLHQYKCNVEKVLSGQMNNIIESHFTSSIPTVCMLH